MELLIKVLAYLRAPVRYTWDGERQCYHKITDHGGTKVLINR